MNVQNTNKDMNPSIIINHRCDSVGGGNIGKTGDTGTGDIGDGANGCVGGTGSDTLGNERLRLAGGGLVKSGGLVKFGSENGGATGVVKLGTKKT
jgi:hypothetical protein